MNAYELHEAAFDSACDHAEDTIAYIQQYADGAFDLFVPENMAEQILNCRQKYLAAVEEDGCGENHHYHLIRVQLEEIQL